MTPWIQVQSNIRSHDKTYALAEELGIKKAHAAGLMVFLWTWAAVNAPDGNITMFSSKAIAAELDWRKKPDVLYNALFNARLIEKVGDQVVIRNWERYATLLMEALERGKKQTNERVKRYRERQSGANRGTATAECNVTETSSNAPTVPNLTVTVEKDTTVSQKKTAALPCSESLSYFIQRLNPTPSETAIAAIVAFEQAMSAEVVKAAINIALDERKHKWSYVQGILRNWQTEGVKCLADVQARQDRRHNGKCNTQQPRKTDLDDLF